MPQFCPISFNKVNESVARSSAVFTVIIAGLYLYSGWSILPLLLFIDFYLRGFGDPKYSIIASVGKTIANSLKFPKKMINAGPKIFAAQVGSILTGVAVLAHYFEYPGIGFYVIAILAFFALLEGALGICVACKLYPIIRKIYPDSYDAGL